MKKVITYGTFDLFHEGHYRLLQRAKALGDYLIVGVTTERYDKARGKLNVVDSLMTRIENVRKSGFADEIIIEETIGQKISDIKKYDVDIFTVGSDWVGKFDYIGEYCEVVYLERTKDISSTQLRHEAHRVQQIGIIGTGRLPARFVKESKFVSGASILGVYNPNKEHAAEFAKRNELKQYETLEELYEAVDIVHIASPHSTHYAYAKDALEHGKHVICEKPMTLRKAETAELYKLAREKNCVLIEDIKTAYCPGFDSLINVARSGIIGQIKYVDACFTRLADKNTRELTDVKTGGSFTEMASTLLLPIMKLMGTEYEDVRFDCIHNEQGLDIFTKATISYERGFASATCGLGVKAEGRLMIAGTEGYIVAEAPWWKTTYFEVRFEDASRVEKYTERFLGDGFRYTISDMVNRINGVTTSTMQLTKEESEAISNMIEQFLGQEER